MAALRTPILLIACAGLFGCQPDPPTLRTAKPAELPPARNLELKPPPKPAQSSPEAQKKLEALLAGHTGGKPELLQKLKSASFTRIGALSANDQVLAATQTVDVSWPVRFKNSTELTTETVATTTFGLSPEANWIAQVNKRFGEAAPQAIPKQKMADDLLLIAQRQFQEDACFLLFPFADPSTRVLFADDTLIGDKDCYGLHVWTPALTYALLHIEKKSNALIRIAYSGRESGKDLVKELLFDELQDYGGIKLPAKVYIRAAGIDLAEWRSLKVTAGKTFDAKHFDGP